MTRKKRTYTDEFKRDAVNKQKNSKKLVSAVRALRELSRKLLVPSEPERHATVAKRKRTYSI